MKTFKITFIAFGLLLAAAFGSYYYVATGSDTTPAAQSGVVSDKTNAGGSVASIEEVAASSSVVADEQAAIANAAVASSSDESPTVTAATVSESLASTGNVPPVVTVISRAEVGDQTVTTSHFQTPSGITSDGAGNLYVTDSARHVVRKISSNLTVSTWAGTSGAAGNTNGLGTAARFNTPKGIAYSAGSLYVADTANGAVRKVSTSDGTVTTLASVTGESVAVDSGGTVYVGDYNSDQVRKVTASGTVSSFAVASSAGTSSAKVEAYVVTGDIDPVNPTWRTWRSTDKGDQSAGLAPVAITEGLYGVRLELTEDTAATISYTPTDFPVTLSWWSHALPYTATYGKTWVFPLMAFHRGTDPISREVDAFSDSQMWDGGGGDVWFKQSANVVVFATAAANPEVSESIYRVSTLTFTSANSGTFTMQYGLYPALTIFTPGTSQLSKVLATTTGRFVINRTSQTVPTQNDFGLYSGFWIE